MALLFMESFDHYTTPLQKWSSQTNGSIGAFGRFSTSGFRMTGGNNFIRRAGPSLGEWVFGFAFKANVFGNNSIFTLQAGANGVAAVAVLSDGRLQWQSVSGGAATGRATSTLTLTTATWHYIEVHVVLQTAASGSVIVKVDGAEFINTSSIITGSATTASGYGVGQAGSINNNITIQWDFDDIYVLDVTGSAPTNDFLGDVRVESILPSGNGNSSQFVGSDSNSTDNYLLVDEAAPDSDTTYVESATVGNKDTYAFGNLTTTSGTVYGLQYLPFAEKTDAGLRSIAAVARLSSTEVDSSNLALASSYAYSTALSEAKPGGGVWTISDVNSAEFGVKITV